MFDKPISLLNENRDEIKKILAEKMYPEWKELGLKDKEIHFLAVFIQIGNKAEAYSQSMARKGTKRSVMSVEGVKVFNRPHVNKAYNVWKEVFLKIATVELEPNLFNLLLRRAFYDIRLFYDDDGEIKKLKDIPEEWRCCLDGMERKFYGKAAEISVDVFTLCNRDKAIEKLMKYIGMEKDDGTTTVISAEIKAKLTGILKGKRELNQIIK